MKIYFCQQCGVSVPLEEVAAGHARSGDGHIYCSHHRPDSESSGDLDLYFCDECSGSIALQDVITGAAPTVEGRTLCSRCARRAKRRAAGASSVSDAPPASQPSGEDDDDPFRLYFCDACNTSIPHSHVVSGRAMVRGGKTYCEGCKSSAAATRRVSPFLPVAGLLLVAAAVLVTLQLAGVFDGIGGAGEPEGPTIEERVGALRDRFDGHLAELRGDLRDQVSRVRDENDAAFRRMTREAEQLDAKLDEANGSIGNIIEMFRERIEKLEARLEKMEELEARVAIIPELEAEIERLRGVRAAADDEKVDDGGGADGGGGDEGAPDPEPKDEIPEEVAKRIARLGHDDSDIRFGAALELGKLGDKRAREPLEEVLLEDEDEFVRRAAASALGDLGDRAACPKLIESLGDVEIYVALQSAKSLQSLTGKNFGFRENLSIRQRRAVIEKWEKWWRDEGS